MGVVHCQESCHFLGRLGMTIFEDGDTWDPLILWSPGFFCWEKKTQYLITSNEIMLGFLKDFLEKATDQGIFFGVAIDGEVF